MYHCFGVPPASAGTIACASVTSAPSLLKLDSSEFLCISHQPANQLGKYRIGEKEINAEKRNRQRHHDRGRNHIRARRPVDLAHLHPHVVKKRTEPLPLRGRFSNRLHQRKSADVVVPFVLAQLSHLRHFINRLRINFASLPPLSFHVRTGRGGGIRTPTLGFGDRWSTVKPTPLNPSLRLEFSLEPASDGGGDSRRHPLVMAYLTSLWPVCFLHVLQNFEVSNRSVCLRRFFVVV